MVTTVCSTVIPLLLTVKKTMSNQSPSACSVNNSDEMGHRRVKLFTAERNASTCSVNRA